MFRLFLGFCCILCCAGAVSVQSVIAQVRIQDSIAILAFDATAQTSGVVIGYHADATTGYDPALGDKPIPPVPAVEAFDFRFIDPPGLRRMPPTGCYRDIRPLRDAGAIDTFRVRVQPQNAAYPIRLGWTPAQLAGFERARMEYTMPDGVRTVDMKESARIELTDTARAEILIVLTHR